MSDPAPRPSTIAELRASGWRSRTVKDELRANLIARLASGDEILPSVVGYEETVLPAIENAILAGQDIVFLGERGQAKTRMARLARRPARRVAAGRPRRRAQRRPVRARSAPAARAHRGARRRRDAHRLAAARPALRREARDARHHDRRPHRRGRPDQGRRGPLPVRRADAPLRPHPARQPRHRRHQRAARPRRADPGGPAQHPRGARRPDPRLHGPPAARPVRRGLGQPGGLHRRAAGSSRRSRTGSARRSGPTTRGRSSTRSRSSARRSSASPPTTGRPAGRRAAVHGGARRRADPPRPPLPGDQPALRRVASACRSRTWRSSRRPRSSAPSGSASRSPRRASRTSARWSRRRSARSSSSRSATTRPRSGSSSGSSRRRSSRRSTGTSTLDDLEPVVEAFEDGFIVETGDRDAVARLRRLDARGARAWTTRSGGSARST